MWARTCWRQIPDQLNPPDSTMSKEAAPHTLEKAARPRPAPTTARAVTGSPSSAASALINPTSPDGKHPSPAMPQRNVLRRPVANPVQRQQPATPPSRPAQTTADHRATPEPRPTTSGHGFSACPTSPDPPPPKQPPQETHGSRRAKKTFNGWPILRHQFPRQPDRRAHRDLLPQHRTNRQFQTVPRPRHPQPRTLGNQPRHQRISRQLPMNAGRSASRSNIRRNRATISGTAAGQENPASLQAHRPPPA